MFNGLENLPVLRDYKRKRISSYDRSGGNKDYITVASGKTAVLGEIEGAGCIKHIWVTIRSSEEWYLRKLVLRMYWDGEKHPSVEVPIGDFFGTSFGENLYQALPMGVTENGGYCLFPMPFELILRE